MNSQNPAPLADTTVACNAYTNDFNDDSQQVGDLAWIRFYPRNKGSNFPYYYVIKLPADFQLANNQYNNPASCSGTYFH
jgi:hypothetical protein